MKQKRLKIGASDKPVALSDIDAYAVSRAWRPPRRYVPHPPRYDEPRDPMHASSLHFVDLCS